MIKTKLIYNPHAGGKWPSFFHDPATRLEDIRDLLKKYEIDFDESPTTAPGDVLKLARAAAKAGYDRVLVAGGDGTVGEAANGLIGTDTALGIMPLGTYMNVARMLSIPLNLEQAVAVIKMGNVRSIDVGEIVSLEEELVDGKSVNEPWYFLESVGIGLEADYQKKYLSWKQGHWKAIFGLIKDMRRFYSVPLHIELDEERSFDSHSHIIMISNGPYMGAGLAIAGTAKLNDHTFTIHRYRMSKISLLLHIMRIKLFGRQNNPDVVTYTSKHVRVTSSERRPVDADARVFGKTPVSLSIKPNALKIIVGFPNVPRDSAMLSKKTILSP